MKGKIIATLVMALCMMLALSFFCAYARELTISSEKAVYEVGEMIKWKMTGNPSYFEVYIDGEKVLRSPTLSGNASVSFEYPAKKPGIYSLYVRKERPQQGYNKGYSVATAYVVVKEHQIVAGIDTMAYETQKVLHPSCSCSDPQYTYASSDPEIVDVSSRGMLYARSPGSAVITISCAQATQEYNLIVTEADEPIKLTMLLGTTTNLADIGFHINNCRFTSFNPEIVSVDENGWMTANSLGMAEIEIRVLNWPNIYYSAQVTVVDNTSAPQPDDAAFIDMEPIRVAAHEYKTDEPVNGVYIFDPFFTYDFKTNYTIHTPGDITQATASLSLNGNIVRSDEELELTKTGELNFHFDYIDISPYIVNGKLDCEISITATDSDNNQISATNSVYLTGVSQEGVETISYPVVEEESLSSSIRIKGPDSGYVQEPITLSYSILPASAVTMPVYWSSDDPSIAQVDQNGRVVLQNVGSTTIRCTVLDGTGNSASHTVTALEREPAPVSLISSIWNNSKVGDYNYWTISLDDPVDTPIVCTARLFLNGVERPLGFFNSTLSFTLSNENKDQEVGFKFDEPGLCVLQVEGRWQDTNEVCLSLSSILRVASDHPIEIGNVASEMPAGTFRVLHPNCPCDEPAYTYTSSAPMVASVTQSGRVNAIMPGNAVITVRCAHASQDYALTVLEADEPDAYTLQLGTTLRLPLRVGYVGDLQYTSSDPDTVSITDEGLMTAHRLGSATIEVSNESSAYNVQITVENELDSSAFVRFNPPQIETITREDANGETYTEFRFRVYYICPSTRKVISTDTWIDISLEINGETIRKARKWLEDY